MNEETRVNWRAFLAYFLLACFIVFTGVGVGVQFGIGLGLATFGVCAGISAYLLGRE